jgi:hypothetical protein
MITRNKMPYFNKKKAKGGHIKGPLVEVYPNPLPIRQTTQVSNARPLALKARGLTTELF